MSTNGATWAIGLWLGMLGAASACGSSVAGGGATSTSSSSLGAAACVAGMQASCACPGGALGAQRCADDGSGFGPCMGCGGAGGGGAGGAGGTSTSSSTSGSSSGGAGGGGPCVGSCAEAIVSGGAPCPGLGDTQYADLIICASGNCNSQCAALIAGGASDAMCGDCLTGNCAIEFNGCANN